MSAECRACLEAKQQAKGREETSQLPDDKECQRICTAGAGGRRARRQRDNEKNVKELNAEKRELLEGELVSSLRPSKAGSMFTDGESASPAVDRACRDCASQEDGDDVAGNVAGDVA
ncbi:uncharacterized protein Z519_02461 [Cladophialophora bantiana CBS 173.52]|uniref:Uncharacterized protein n=1 Tax=Cladophialophora bantiana (strain ATCC 10958 / CBS 173.52 / CDC B-1940 / NIH 8579) TaxID=1442370 RepID=A0A0D2IJW6_CLAB1|nr:uncharacterized protein Z519_02461 [Cladophialophora bantiana CBS 173.52]KIW97069.1 hypothetical protein Z519_02461 [Cladophialophora bantiana CBS 173.52]